MVLLILLSEILRVIKVMHCHLDLSRRYVQNMLSCFQCASHVKNDVSLKNVQTVIYQMAVTARDCVTVGKVASNIDLLPACFQETLSAIVRSAEFRSVDTFQEQVIYRKMNTKLTLEMIGMLLGKSKSTVHRCWASRLLEKEPDNPARHGKSRRGPRQCSHIDGRRESHCLD